MVPTTHIMARMVNSSPWRSAMPGHKRLSTTFRKSQNTKGMITAMGNWEWTKVPEPILCTTWVR